MIAFFLLEPPQDVDQLPDFRLQPDNRFRQWSPEMHQAFRRVRSQRESAIAVAEAANDPPPELGLSLDLREDPEEAAERVRRWLDPPPSDVLAELSPGRVLRAWSDAVERHTILVAQVENVPVREMRGFSLSDRPFPIIAINSGDSLRGRVFTLVHELCHVLLHHAALCDLDERRKQPRTIKERVERFCNEVAAATLMPRAEVLSLPSVRHASRDHTWSDKDLTSLASRFGVSNEAMLLRLVTLGKATIDYYFRRRRHFLAIYEMQKRREELRRSARPSGGMSPYRRKLRNLGRQYVRSVIDAYEQEQINGADAAYYLGIKLNRLPELREAMDKD